MAKIYYHQRYWHRKGWAAIAILGATILAVIALIDNAGWQTNEWVDVRAGRAFTKPLRLEVSQANVLNELILGLRSFHYRTYPVSQSDYRDVYYDTKDWDLYKQGYSYRFRTRLSGPRLAKYTIRLEQEPRFVPENSKKLDVRSELTAALGNEITRGAWEKTLHPDTAIEATKSMQRILHKLRIDPSLVKPRLIGELRRDRYEIRDKGRNWFELDHELWTFRPFEGSALSSQITMEDMVIDTRLSKRDPELFRRVRTMDEYIKMIPGVLPQDRAPIERAIEQMAVTDEAVAPAVLSCANC